jgi:hypothetical protein
LATWRRGAEIEKTGFGGYEEGAFGQRCIKLCFVLDFLSLQQSSSFKFLKSAENNAYVLFSFPKKFQFFA